MAKDWDFAEKKMFIDSRPIVCEECHGKLFYQGGGRYRCENCGNIQFDAFGIVKEYLHEHGPTPSYIISTDTGVSMELLNLFLRKGRLEIPEGSDIYIKCQKCGCSIRYGRFCVECARLLTNDIQSAMRLDVGEKPKLDRSGKMHYQKEEEKEKLLHMYESKKNKENTKNTLKR